MIEYRYNRTGSKWIKVPIIQDPSTYRFVGYIMRINGVEYTKSDAEFLDAYEKERFWGKLRD